MPVNLSLPPVPATQDSTLRQYLVQERELILKLLSLVASAVELEKIRSDLQDQIDALP